MVKLYRRLKQHNLFQNGLQCIKTIHLSTVNSANVNLLCWNYISQRVYFSCYHAKVFQVVHLGSGFYASKSIQLRLSDLSIYFVSVYILFDVQTPRSLSRCCICAPVTGSTKLS